MHGVYATAWEVVDYLGIQDGQTFIIDDDRFLRFTVMMSRKFDALAKRFFVPIRATYTYDHPDETVFREIGGSREVAGSGFVTLPNVLKLDHDLLSLITLTTNNGNTVIPTGTVILRTGPSLNYIPYDTIELDINEAQNVFLFSGTPQQSNTVDGIHGFHESYSGAWQTLDTVQDVAGLNTTVTTITVTDADAFDELGLTPRFQQQQLLRLGTTDTSEMVYVSTINYSLNTVQVIRGVNGSTAATAANGTAIQVYRPMDEIKHAMLILSAHAYRRKDTVGTEAERNVFTPTGVLIIPQQIPSEVADMILAYKRPFIRSYG